MTEKLVIIINGRGGVGKDTLCELAAKYYSVMNISSITPVKEIAQQCGWMGEKTDKSRKFLSDLKRLLSDYNDYPTEYLLTQYRMFLESDCQILFVHIREGAEIDKFRSRVDTACIALLITSVAQVVWGNDSDDAVGAYQYDYVFDNSMPLADAELKFKDFIEGIFNEVYAQA